MTSLCKIVVVVVGLRISLTDHIYSIMPWLDTYFYWYYQSSKQVIKIVFECFRLKSKITPDVQYGCLLVPGLLKLWTRLDRECYILLVSTGALVITDLASLLCVTVLFYHYLDFLSRCQNKSETFESPLTTLTYLNQCLWYWHILLRH